MVIKPCTFNDAEHSSRAPECNQHGGCLLSSARFDSCAFVGRGFDPFTRVSIARIDISQAYRHYMVSRF